MLELEPFPLRLQFEESQAALFEDEGGDCAFAFELFDEGELSPKEAGLAVAFAVVDEEASPQVAGLADVVGLAGGAEDDVDAGPFGDIGVYEGEGRGAQEDIQRTQEPVSASLQQRLDLTHDVIRNLSALVTDERRGRQEGGNRECAGRYAGTWNSVRRVAVERQDSTVACTYELFQVNCVPSSSPGVHQSVN